MVYLFQFTHFQISTRALKDPNMMLNLLVISLVALASSSPTPADLSPRACNTTGPSTIAVIDRNAPNTPSAGQQFTLDRKYGSNSVFSLLTFGLIPSGATSCMLEFTIPALDDPNQIASGTATQADIWTTDPWDDTNPPTYSSQPQRREFVSTTIFPTGATSNAFQTVLASNVCSKPMSFLVELSTWQSGEGHVDFINSLGGVQGIEPIGFKMVYNC